MRTTSSAQPAQRRRPVASYTHAPDVRDVIVSYAKAHGLSLSTALDLLVRAAVSR